MQEVAWHLGTSAAIIDAYNVMIDRNPPGLDAPNWNTFRQALNAIAREQGRRAALPPGVWPLDRLPPFRLTLTDPSFAPDFFRDAGFFYVSRRFRDAAEAAGGKVAYVPVDLTGSHPGALAQDYRMLNVIELGLDKSPFALTATPEGALVPTCTDAFAEALQRARLTGIRFRDVVTHAERPAPPLLPGDPGSGVGG